MAVTKDIFKTPTQDGTTTQLAEHLPQGKAWEAKGVDGTNLRALVSGCAKPFNTTQKNIEVLCNEFNINTTTLLIDEWEESVGLPDDCLGPTSNLQLRRDAVIQRLRRTPFVTLQEMQDYVDELFPGAGIILFTGVEYYTFEYDFEMIFLGEIDEKFVIVAELPVQDPKFEYEFEYQFTGAADQTKLRCILERVLPANVLLIIEEVLFR